MRIESIVLTLSLSLSLYLSVLLYFSHKQFDCSSNSLVWNNAPLSLSLSLSLPSLSPIFLLSFYLFSFSQTFLSVVVVLCFEAASDFIVKTKSDVSISLLNHDQNFLNFFVFFSSFILFLVMIMSNLTSLLCFIFCQFCSCWCCHSSVWSNSLSLSLSL